MRQLPLWDQLGMRRLGWFTLPQLQELVDEGFAVRRCRVCGRGDVPVKSFRPRQLDDVDRWIQWLDEVPRTSFCQDHWPQCWATSELRTYETRSRSPKTVRQAEQFFLVGDKRLPNHREFRPTIFYDVHDQVHDQLIKGL